jgi:hypothetical protein
MISLTHYPDFLARVDELGFLPLSRFLPGMPSLSEETPGNLWHTGNYETDPWQWKDRAAEEKKLAYGCILGGHKGFVSRRLYALFYAACRPPETMDERWRAGELSLVTWKLWGLFEKKPALDTSEARRALGGTASQADSALRQLQQEYWITIAGTRRKVGKDGQPYGWPASLFEQVERWAPPEWLAETSFWDQAEAREAILEVGVGMGAEREALRKMLGFVRNA